MKVIKICGLTRMEDILYVNTYQPDYIGFVFAKSKRQVTIKQAQQLKEKLDTTIKAVGVFVNASIKDIVEVVEKKCIDIVQLHGDEDVLYIQQLKEVVSVPIIKAIKVSKAEDIENIAYDVDYYLLDNKVAGSGQAFDWSIIKRLDKPFFLAGGITLDNIQEALTIPCYGIDVSSGVESKGSKDKQKIEIMVRRIQNEGR